MNRIDYFTTEQVKELLQSGFSWEEIMYMDILEIDTLCFDRTQVPKDINDTIINVIASEVFPNKKKQRNALVMYYMQPFSFHQIGISLEVSKAQAKKLFEEAMTIMRYRRNIIFIKYGASYLNRVFKTVCNNIVQPMELIVLAKELTYVCNWELSDRAMDALVQLGCNSIYDVLILKPDHILRLKGIGPKTVEEIVNKRNAWIEKMGFSVSDFYDEKGVYLFHNPILARC